MFQFTNGRKKKLLHPATEPPVFHDLIRVTVCTTRTHAHTHKNNCCILWFLCHKHHSWFDYAHLKVCFGSFICVALSRCWFIGKRGNSQLKSVCSHRWNAPFMTKTRHRTDFKRCSRHWPVDRKRMTLQGLVHTHASFYQAGEEIVGIKLRRDPTAPFYTHIKILAM